MQITLFYRQLVLEHIIQPLIVVLMLLNETWVVLSPEYKILGIESLMSFYLIYIKITHIINN